MIGEPEWTGDAAAWDTQVLGLAHPALLQSWRWGQLQAGYGWRCRRILVHGEGLGMVPVTVLVARALPTGTWWYVPRGPGVDAAHLGAAMEELARRADMAGAIFLRVEPPAEAGFAAPPGWVDATPAQPQTTSIVDIGRDDEAILASLKPKTRYNIRLAEKKGVKVELSDDVDEFSRLSGETSSRHGIQLASRAYYRDLLLELRPAGMARMYLARHGGRALAGVIVTRFGNQATYLFGASGREGRNVMPAYLLHWRAIRDVRADGATSYDLWGMPPTDDPKHPWAGLYQFKSGWNGRLVEYAGAWDRPLRPALWRAHRSLSTIRTNLRHAKSRLSHGG
ncbi:MAG: lipid II:glycine glycyltransferase FemX [Candidatus Dormibacteria bacterium]